MDGDQVRVPCAFIRGGTSRGLYFLAKDLPTDPATRDRVILAAYGSPDPRQINGIGGADPLTSKVAIISPSQREDADVDYTFGQVSITASLVDYGSSCGNIASGVGPFAIDEGLVKAVEPITRVRIYHTNIKRVIIAEVPVRNGKAQVEGNCAIDGVPGTGAPILLDFPDSGGALTGALLPTGYASESIQVDGLSLTVSIVDAAVPAIFARAEELGLTGVELPDAINADQRLLTLLEKIRSLAAEMIGIVKDRGEATRLSPSVPKVAFVSPKVDYLCSEGRMIQAHDIDFVSRIMSMQVAHNAYAVTGGICTATAAKIPGTIVNQVYTPGGGEKVRIGHASGSIAFEIVLEAEGSSYRLRRAALERTSRRLMDGYVYVPRRVFAGEAEALVRQRGL